MVKEYLFFKEISSSEIIKKKNTKLNIIRKGLKEIKLNPFNVFWFYMMINVFLVRQLFCFWN